MQLVLFWVFAVLMLLFGAAVAYVRERQGRGGLWDASKDQRLPLNGGSLGLLGKYAQMDWDFAQSRFKNPAEPPGLDQKNAMLRLKGYFPGQPVQINFEMLFQAVNGRWRLFGLSVQPGPATPPPASASAPAPGAAAQQ